MGSATQRQVAPAPVAAAFGQALPGREPGDRTARVAASAPEMTNMEGAERPT